MVRQSSCALWALVGAPSQRGHTPALARPVRLTAGPYLLDGNPHPGMGQVSEEYRYPVTVHELYVASIVRVHMRFVCARVCLSL